MLVCTCSGVFAVMCLVCVAILCVFSLGCVCVCVHARLGCTVCALILGFTVCCVFVR